ncbi:MAG TPA: endolytic transglycosylase MltG, partial [Arenibaculum sp.]|nr:endolytic transglycosylase MltG [Arenibaculum sp.]
MRLAARIAAASLAVVLTLAAGGAFGLYRTLSVEGPLEAETLVVIPRGAGLVSIAGKLAEAGVVDRRWKVSLAARVHRPEQSLKAGEYAFPAGVSVFGALDIIRDGRTVIRRFTVPEGLTSAQVVELLEREAALAGDAPPVPSEGSLLPETYHFSHGDLRSDLIGRMQAKMEETLVELWDGRAPHSPAGTPEEAVVLASIVEKETSVPQERAKVAGVFANRIARGMRLQSDPTVVYALTDGKGPLGRPLTRKDWTFVSPYNTYVADGLPPGPIANPGRASIEAVLDP